MWLNDYDKNDNTVWELASPYVGECGSPEFYWRITQILSDNKIKFSIKKSDFELLEQGDEYVFRSLKKAKKYCENQNKLIIKTILNEELALMA
jgi:hypothetical protein